MWTRHLMHRGWRATVFLVVLAGLSGGVAMAACAAGRRTVTAFDRFLARADPPDLIVTFCPPDMVEITESDVGRCFSYPAVDETKVLESLPEVEAAARATFRGLTAARSDEPDTRWLANSTMVFDDDINNVEGEPIVVAGRWFSPHSPEEVVVNERFQENSGIALGEEMVLKFWRLDEIGRVPADGEQLNGPSAHVRVVGVVRGLLDLSAGTDSDIRTVDEAEVIGGPALAIATESAGGYGGVVIRARGDAQLAALAIQRAFPDRRFNMASVIGDEEIEPIRESINYEARAAMIFAAIASIASAVFVGQAVARQSRREWSDMSTLRALGMARREIRWTASLRGASIGGPAALVAIAVAIVLSPLGPIGVGRRAEVNPGVSVDVVVLATGTLILLVLVTGATVFPLARRSRPTFDAPSASRRLGSHALFPAPAIAGLGMTTGARRDGRATPIGTALAGAALAVVAIVAGASLTASLDTLIETPDSFGAPWDISVANISGDAEGTSGDFTALLASDPAVAAAAGIVGTDVEIDGEVIWVQAFRSIGNVADIAPVITDGREPTALDEIALGSITMNDLGVEVGDSVVVQSTVSLGAPTTMNVVGTAVVNDTYETSPGRGGIVAVEWVDANSPGSWPDPYVVRLDENADASAFSAAVEGHLPAIVSPPIPQGAIRNVERIASLPFLLAALVAVLAMASLSHALTLSIRRSRNQMAVWKSIGFTEGQVRSAVAWHASALAFAATVIGVPIGVVLGRLGWRVVANQIGVASNPVTPLAGIAVAAIGALAIANLIAAYPGWRAARLPTAQALRAE